MGLSQRLLFLSENLWIRKSPQTLMFTGFVAAASAAGLAPRVGLEPTTTQLSAECSAIVAVSYCAIITHLRVSSKR